MNNIRNNYVNMVCLVLINSIIIIYPITLYFSDFVGKHAPAYYLGLLNHEIVFSATILLLSGLSLLINSNKKILNITKEKLYLFIMLAALVGWINLSSLWSLSAYMSAPEIGVWTSYLLWWILMLSLFEKNDCYIIIQIIMISIILSASVYISYFINDYYTPYFLLNINRSIVSECLLAISPFLLGYGLQKERLEGNLCVLLSFISLVAIILIGQRAPLYSMLAIMSLLVISVAIHWERMRKKILFFGASLIIMLSCIIMANPHKKSSDHWDTVSRTYNINQASETLDYRINGFLVCWYQWKDQWLFGTGQGTYQMSYPLYAHHLPLNEYARFSRRLENSQVSRAHCEPVQIAAELGIFGITLWLAIFIVYPIFLAYDSIKKKQIITLCGSAGIMGVAISSLASSFATRTILPGIIIMTVYYLSLNQMNDKKNSKNMLLSINTCYVIHSGLH
ncbi:O-antigen ligase family protein [Oscillatoria amoena NRMC-F 0135]|nr:O-antigen ligase family protein [Oscillatoria amoena NRMC-F 0135]